MNMLRKSLVQQEVKETGGVQEPSETLVEAKDTEIRNLRQYIKNMQQSYESTFIRLRKVVEDATMQQEAVEGSSNDLRKQIALLQVNERNLQNTVAQLTQKKNQYFEVSMMQLEELGNYNLR